MACLPNELIVWEILVRLPVKSLWRIRCVCKDWRDTISGDPSFAQSHLRRLPLQKEKYHRLLIAPRAYSHVIEPRIIKDAVTTPRLYRWEESRPHAAALLHDTSSLPAEVTWRRHAFAHCDGLVLLSTEASVCVLNPVTHDVAPRRCLEVEGHQAFVFGRDHRYNAYKVACLFHREAHAMGNLGMEVFTVGKDQCWRETSAQPPYPFIVGRTATFFKGSLIWTVNPDLLMNDESSLDGVANKPCFVLFSLEDESFKVMKGPPWYEGDDCFDTSLAELNGVLAVPRQGFNELVEIWMCDDGQGNKAPRWEPRHVLDYRFSIRLIAMCDDEIVYQDGADYLRRHSYRGDKVMFRMNLLEYYDPNMGMLVGYLGKDVVWFDVMFYIPTLVQI
ncbi:hypothetical protein VPH35_120032 [Triticum aestivum]